MPIMLEAVGSTSNTKKEGRKRGRKNGKQKKEKNSMICRHRPAKIGILTKYFNFQVL